MFRHLTIDYRTVILVKEFLPLFLQSSNGSLDTLLVILFQSFQQLISIRYFRKLCTQHQGFINGLLMIYSVMAFCNNLLDTFISLTIRVISCFVAKSQKTFLLIFLTIEYLERYKSFVHTDGILPVIGRRSILGCILDACLGIFCHFLTQHTQTNSAHGITHKVGSLHTFLHFITDHVTPVTSGESHYKSKITFLNAIHIDSKVLLDFQRNIVCCIIGRFTIFRCINTEDRKVTTMTRPHPVIRISSKLSDRRRRSTYHTNILIYCLYKQIIFISSVERFQFDNSKIVCLYILFLGKTFSHSRQV